MKEKTPQFALPISAKSYARLKEVINIVSTNNYTRRQLSECLDRYLEGDKDYYLRQLNREHLLAFKILLIEVEAAIRRSEMARERARARKQLRRESPQKSEKPTEEKAAPASQQVCAMPPVTTNTDEPLESVAKPRTSYVDKHHHV